MTSFKSLSEFFETYPTMRKVVSPIRGTTMIAGTLSFIARHPKYGDMGLSYNLLFQFSKTSPHTCPIVYETRGVIPRKPENHIGNNGCICLGSPLQLRNFAKLKPTLCCFVEKIVIPYLYAIILKLLHYDRNAMVFGELAHGSVGLYEEFMQQFSIGSNEEALHLLKILNFKQKAFEETLCPLCKKKKIKKCKHWLVFQEWRDMLQNDENYQEIFPISLYFSTYQDNSLKSLIFPDEEKDSLNIRQILEDISFNFAIA